MIFKNSSLFSSAERLKSLRDGVNPFIFAAVAPLSFIVHVQEYLCPFLFGGCVHILSDTVAHSLLLLEEYYTKHSITFSSIEAFTFNNSLLKSIFNILLSMLAIINFIMANFNTFLLK